MSSPARLCPACGRAELIQDTQRVWPVGWVCGACGEAVAAADGIPLFAWKLADTVTGMDPQNFAFLAEVEQRHFWFAPRNRLITGLVKRYFPDADDIFEVGCGTGIVLSALSEARRWRRIAGSELHPSGLKVARRRLGPAVELVQMDARAIPAERVFDVIGAFDVIEHIKEDEQVLQAMHRAVRPGGGVIVAVPQHPWLWSAADVLGHHIRRYRRGELETKIRNAGFRTLFTGSYNFLLLPLMAASRIAERLSSKHPKDAVVAVEAEFAVPHALNALFKAALQAEVSLTLRGLRFPAGGSRIVVARKFSS